jgi:hypothetical protein
MTMLIWKDKRDIDMLTNIHAPSAEGNFSDEHRSALQPAIVAGYVNKADRTQQLLHQPSDLEMDEGTFLPFTGSDDSEQLHPAVILWCGTLPQRLVRNMLEHAAICRPCPQRPLGRPPALSSTIFRLEEANRHHWPTHSDKRMNRRVCSAQSARNVTWACACSGATRSTTQRRDLVR